MCSFNCGLCTFRASGWRGCLDSEGMTMMCVAKYHLNIYTVGNPLIINRSSYSWVCMCANQNAQRTGTNSRTSTTGMRALLSSYLEAKENRTKVENRVCICVLGGYLF